MIQHLFANGKLVVWWWLFSGHVALLLWAQPALLPVSAEFQIHPQGCSEASTEKGGCFRQEVPLGPNAPSVLGRRKSGLRPVGFQPSINSLCPYVCTSALDANTTSTAARHAEPVPQLWERWLPQRWLILSVGGGVVSASKGWKTSGDAQNLRAVGQGASCQWQLRQFEDHCPAFSARWPQPAVLLWLACLTSLPLLVVPVAWGMDPEVRVRDSPGKDREVAI